MENAGPGAMICDGSLLTENDLFLFNQGTHYRLYEKLGSLPLEHKNQEGTFFVVWAPNAEGVSVMGIFKGWDKSCHLLRPRGVSGTWEDFIPAVPRGAAYQYPIQPCHQTYRADKSYPDAWQYGGTGQGNLGGVEAAPIPLHGRPCMLNITLPPLSAVFFKREGGPK